jgi:hypothetical protein
VTIHADSGQWNVRVEDHDSGKEYEGSGPDFGTAWNDVTWSPLKRAAAKSLRKAAAKSLRMAAVNKGSVS